MKRLIALGAAALLIGASGVAPAQTAASSAPASPAKKDLVQRFITLQQASLDSLSRTLVESPARQLLAAAEPVLRSKVAADKREAVAKQLQDEARKFIDESQPIVRKRALELAQSQLAPALEEKFSEDELRQIVGFYESPAQKKLQQTLPELSDALAQKLVAETRPTIQPKVKALETSMAKALGVPPPGAAPPASGPAGSGLKPPAATRPGLAASRP
jgi:hypothetical protein